MDSALLYTKRINGDGSSDDISLNEWKKERKSKWLHFQLTEESTTVSIMEMTGLSELVITALTVEDSRPRAVEMEDGHLICLRGVNCNPGEDPEDMVSIRLWINKHMIVSCRHDRVEAIKDILNQFEQKKGPENTEDFLLELCDSLTYRISDTVNQLEDQVDILEENYLEDDVNHLRQNLYKIRRKIIHLRRHISPQRESLLRLFTKAPKWFSEINKMYFMELVDRTMRCLEELDAARDRCTVIQEELTVKLTEEMNRTIYIMSIVATIFLPLSLLTGLLGINVGGIPGSDNGIAFWVVCGILGVVALIEYLWFKKRRVL